MSVPHGSDHCQPQRVLVKGTAGRGSAHAPASPNRRVLSDPVRFMPRTAGKQIANLAGHQLDQVLVIIAPELRFPLAPRSPQTFIGKTFLLRARVLPERTASCDSCDLGSDIL